MAADKPVIHVWPMNPQIKLGEGFTMDVQLTEGADYNVRIVSTSKLMYDKNTKRLSTKTGGGTGNGITAEFTPTKNGVNGETVVVTVNIVAANATLDMNTYKPVIKLLDTMPITVPVNTTQPVNMVIQPAGATVTKNDKRADVVTYDIATKSITTKGLVTQGTQYPAAWIDLTPTTRIGNQDVRGDVASIGVTTVQAQTPPPAEKPTITIDPMTVNIQKGGTQVLNITLSEGADYEAVVASPANIGYDKATKTITGKNVMQGGQITFTPSKDGVSGDPVVVTVNIAEQSGGGNQGGGDPQPPVQPPVQNNLFTVEPQVAVIANKKSQVFTITNEGDNLQVECDPADAITWSAASKSITAKRTGQFAVRFIKSATEVVVVNLTVTPEPSVWDKFESFTEVKNLLADAAIAPKDKFDQLDNSVSQCGSLVQSLSTYNTRMGPSVPNILPKNGAAQNYNLLNQIMYIVELSNKEEFTVQFDIVNLYFKEYKNEAYNEHLMQRFDNYWIWDAKALTTYQNLVTCITMLCDITTRAENLKKISLDKVLDPKETLFSPTAIANIKAYYIP